jgi:general secretion pathway protein G
MMARNRSRRPPGRAAASGFTLIELLVVLVILGLLAAFVAPQVLKYLSKAKTDVARAQVVNIASILDLYKLEVGHYPDQQEGLEALVQQPPNEPRWNGPYVKKVDALIDPWGEMYQYRIPGEHGPYDLFTLGADKAVGGEGEDQDVTSW